MSVEVRTIDESDLPGWIRAMNTGFLRPPGGDKEEVALRTAGTDLDRAQGAFDGDRCVATYRSFPQRLSVPGGRSVAADAVSGVTVSPTHRRRGLLSRMIERDLRAAKERGDLVATLIAAEWPIYGRYGFGPGTWTTRWEVEVARTGLDRRYAGPADGGRVDLVGLDTVRALGPALHARMSAVRHGVVDRADRWWQMNTGVLPRPGTTWTEPFTALYRAPDGTPEGLVAYTSDDDWDAKRPRNTLTVLDLVAVSSRAERALWHFLLSIDWAWTVDSGHRAPDDLLPLLLPDVRAARVTTHADFLWLRPLDVPGLLRERAYAAPGALVLEVSDPSGLAGGRFLLEADEGGAQCAPTARPADIALDLGALSALYLGDESAVRLAALGRLDEQRPGAVARAELMLRTARRPWCPDSF
ncbi:GNAT family N-acetyltransferase [Streptomyces sp. NPDC049555]|uniref:GNAT family N-acetyltransferase n=1 Tax=Streptomyces sp. NPDC049555 TaxID=3154930 RepID=UPI00341A7A3C